MFKVKPDDLFKSRFYAQGFSQVAGTGSTYAPVCRIPSVRIVLAIAASHDWNVIQLDVETAFLQSEMKEEVYVKQPVGFEKLDLNGQPYVYKLRKSLYWLKQVTPQLARNYPTWTYRRRIQGLHVQPMCLRQEWQLV